MLVQNSFLIKIIRNNNLNSINTYNCVVCMHQNKFIFYFQLGNTSPVMTSHHHHHHHGCCCSTITSRSPCRKQHQKYFADNVDDVGEEKRNLHDSNISLNHNKRFDDSIIFVLHIQYSSFIFQTLKTCIILLLDLVVFSITNSLLGESYHGR